MTTKLEQIARAIKTAQFGWDTGLSKEGPWREFELKIARAAVEALREPTSEMLVAGHGELAVCVAGPDASDAILGNRTCHQGITDVYTAMIDAMLEPNSCAPDQAQNGPQAEDAKPKDEVIDAYRKCFRICDHAIRHYKGPVAEKIRREIAMMIDSILTEGKQ